MNDRPTEKKKAIEFSDTGTFFREMDVEFLVHELKDPISIIETAVRMLLEKQNKFGALTHRQARTLKRALRNSQKTRDMLADLLEVGRSDCGCIQCHRFDPVEIVENVVVEALEYSDDRLWEELQGMDVEENRCNLLGQHGIYLDYSENAGSTGLYQDETKFRQIVGNLIKNALHYRKRNLEIAIDSRDDRLFIDVMDDGPGVEPENRELIFNRYTRLKECVCLSRTRHGLGLAGARRLARHLGGDITVISGPGKGTGFSLMIPLTFDENR